MLPKDYMQKALDLAHISAEQDEIPVGCLIVNSNTGEIIASSHNLSQHSEDATAHAEIVAIRKACKKLNQNRLWDMDMYVTLEPCPMCMGASLNARVDKIYFGAYEQKGRSLTAQLADANLLNHKTEVVGGVLEEECSSLLTAFFSGMRQKQKQEKERKKLNAENDGGNFVQNEI